MNISIFLFSSKTKHFFFTNFQSSEEGWRISLRYSFKVLEKVAKNSLFRNSRINKDEINFKLTDNCSELVNFCCKERIIEWKPLKTFLNTSQEGFIWFNNLNNSILWKISIEKCKIYEKIVTYLLQTNTYCQFVRFTCNVWLVKYSLQR